MASETQAGVLKSVDPATLEEVGSVPVAPPEEVAEVVTEARLAAERWAQSLVRRAPGVARGGGAGVRSRAPTCSPRP